MGELIGFSDVLAQNEKVFVDFWATWCGPCRITKPFVEEIEKERPDVKVIKIDVDENKDLAISLGISSIPTFQFYKAGKLISERIGAIPKNDMTKMIDKI